MEFSADFTNAFPRLLAETVMKRTTSKQYEQAHEKARKKRKETGTRRGKSRKAALERAESKDPQD